MATYLVVPDDYAGWNSTGRNFALVGAAAGAVGLLSWMSLHNHLGVFRPGKASHQIFLYGLVWLGVGGASLMTFAALGSILLSVRSHGIVGITAEGISRSVNARTRTRTLAWSEILGLVAMPYGGVTLIAARGKSDIVIPRFLDDYRACIKEITDHGIHLLPPSSLHRKSKTSWRGTTKTFGFIFVYTLATASHDSHRTRIACISSALVLAVWLLQDDSAKDVKERLDGSPSWFSLGSSSSASGASLLSGKPMLPVTAFLGSNPWGRSDQARPMVQRSSR